MLDQPTSVTHVDQRVAKDVSQALGRIPQGLFVMSARHEQGAQGVVVSWVQQVSFNPPLVMVALQKGRAIVPLVHGSKSFALNQVTSDDKLLLKTFTRSQAADDDAFEAVRTLRRTTGSPILTKAQAFMDCELVRHIDVEGDHDLYIGKIIEAGVLNEGDVTIRFRDDGLKY